MSDPHHGNVPDDRQSTRRLPPEQLLEIKTDVQHAVVSKLAQHVAESEEYLTSEARREQRRFSWIVLGATVGMAVLLILFSSLASLQLKRSLEETINARLKETLAAQEERLESLRALQVKAAAASSEVGDRLDRKLIGMLEALQGLEAKVSKLGSREGGPEPSNSRSPGEDDEQ